MKKQPWEKETRRALYGLFQEEKKAHNEILEGSYNLLQQNMDFRQQVDKLTKDSDALRRKIEHLEILVDQFHDLWKEAEKR